MVIMERRIVEQNWYNFPLRSTTGWRNSGWVYSEDQEPMGLEWDIVEVLNVDKHDHPILAIAEREVNTDEFILRINS